MPSRAPRAAHTSTRPTREYTLSRKFVTFSEQNGAANVRFWTSWLTGPVCRYEPEWQRVFWGTKYERLLEIKRRIDPTNLFVCNRCVGTDIVLEP